MVERSLCRLFSREQDLEDFGMDKVIEMALEAAWDGCDAVYMSCELDKCVPATHH